HEPDPGIQFVPPNAHALGLIAYGNTAYVATADKCGGAANGIWALDITTKKVTQWKTENNIAGNAGPAVGPDGTLYVAAGNELVALAPHTLESLAIYKTDGAEFSSTPVVFSFQGKNLIAAATKDGRLQLLDTAALNKGTPLATSGAFSGRNYATGSLTSWEDPSGARWILAPASGSIGASAGFPLTNGDVSHGAIVAWKVVDRGGAASLVPGWISRDMISPLPPIVVNGVVFAVSSGDRHSAHAVLYAFDSDTGQELWSSGKSIGSFVLDGGLAAGGSRIYVATHDGTQYAFGFPIEH
ncbi:MAG: PQQ-binding-like beta-propeller repeat protein, partial [Bryobacteraceae bacterium]